MDHFNHIHIHIPMLLISSICFSLLTTLPQSHSQPLPFSYSDCRQHSYNCGNLSNIFYPFWGSNQSPQCGGGHPFQLQCDHDLDITSIQIDSHSFRVLNINTTTYAVRIVQTYPAPDICSSQYEETDYMNTDFTPFWYGPSVQNITIFYDCPNLPTFPCNNYQNHKNATYYTGGQYELLAKHPDLSYCNRSVQVPAAKAPPNPDYKKDGLGALQTVIGQGFDVYYDVSQECKNCWKTEGVCWTDDRQIFSCYCPDGSTSPRDCSKKITLNLGRKIAIGVTGVLAAIAGVLICIMIYSFGLCKSSTWQRKIWIVTKNNQDIEAFLKNHEGLAQKRYKFSEIKRMTSSFKDKLGQGGYGAVYKGKLPTGCFVAVKLLNASKGNGEEFVNEVASISRTSHVNIVTLVGFCLEGSKKALIYEFMTNGSLERFIFKKGPETIPSLNWENLHQIAIGIARGLEYLHRGCNTRILHFDIKPHNILLDEDFNPKISDFGLAKLCPKNKSIVSMSDPRGTIGYLAPEMSNGRFGGVSHKSDVYSYGMILLDMVEGRKNTNVEATHTSEKYFPDWIYNKLEQGDMRSDGVMGTEENEIARKITVVGLWCIQTFPNDRPTISRVIEMLEGSKNHLEIPPKPFLSSPPRSIPESTTA